MRLRRARLKLPLHTIFSTREAAEGYMQHIGAVGMVYYPPTLMDLLQHFTGWISLTYPDDLANIGPDETLVSAPVHGPMQ